MESSTAIWSAIELRAARSPRAPALLAPGVRATSYRELHQQLEETRTRLRELGISRSDRVALVLPNGARLASAFLSVAGSAVCAPLNPAYGPSDYEFFLSDLGVRALIIEEGCAPEAVKVAAGRGIDIIELVPDPSGAGRFGLRHDLKRAGVEESGQATSGDPCLVLHTSGTTSRPKQVPLSQENLLKSAANIAATLQLTREDRCLNVMPLFHIHGIVGAVLSTLCSGGQVICAPGPRFPEFFAWLKDLSPSWYTAVPTIHQAVLSCLSDNMDLAIGHRLRFIRSSSASLAPQVMAELEHAFLVPAIEAYGMTEGSHQIACNPLPPDRRKPGSVGPSAGPEVAIMDEQGDLVCAEGQGEVVIRGDSVTLGYANNPQANSECFTKSWFRTGDIGYLDGDGYLFLVGRKKEIINRGGEKISPREIDETLIAHAAVAEAVAFSIPHSTLGEDLGAAVTLRPGAAATESELRAFLRERTAAYKVPIRIVIVESIPKGPTGKLQRIGLYEKLKEALQAPQSALEHDIEKELHRIWKQVLKIDKIGRHDNFFLLGGDSLRAATVIALAIKAGIDIAPTTIFERPTIAEIAQLAGPRRKPG